MWPFTQNIPLTGTGILKGWTDWHSHILPSVDDGIRTMEESLAVLAWYEREGVREVWLTPHIMEDIPNHPKDLKVRFEELCAAYKGPIRLHLAAEHMLDPLFEERLEAGEVLPIGPGGDTLLVETSYFNPPVDMSGLLDKIHKKGYRPLLAHPERYVYMDKGQYLRLHHEGTLLQLNLPSLSGAFGPDAKRKALFMLKEGLYDRCGSDLHSLADFHGAMIRIAFPKKYADLLPR